MKNVSLIFLLLFSLSSCVFDCLNTFQGVVYDSKTKKPISNVNVATIINGKVYNDYGWITDSLRISDRKEYIKIHGNKEKWEETPKGTYIHRMHRIGPLLTDSSGSFNIIFMTGFCMPAKLLIIKNGYHSIITKEIKTSRDTIRMFLTKIE